MSAVNAPPHPVNEIAVELIRHEAAQWILIGYYYCPKSIEESKDAVGVLAGWF